MRLAVLAIAALLIGAFGAHFLLENRGYVLLSFRSYTVEMSVPVLVLVLVLLYVAVRLLLRIWRAPRQLGEAFVERRHRKAAEKLTRGLIHMAEGQYTRSERLLTEGLRGGDAPLVNYLMAARAAQQQGSRERRNEWLKLAYETLPDAESAILVTQAELQLADGEHEHALATLQRVLDKEPRHAAALALLAEAYMALGDADQLVDWLPKLVKAKVPPPRLATAARAALGALLRRTDVTADAYRAIWDNLPGETRRDPALIRLHALVLERLDKRDEAVKALQSALKRSWHPALVRAFGEVRGNDTSRQLRIAESWLKQHPEDSLLLLTAARLCMANELWGKARSYLESSLALAPEPAAYALYGQLLDRLGEQDQAALAYRSGLELASGVEVGRPALAAPAESEQPPAGHPAAAER